jgi:FKBP-type peptidyl-prolyl cis-trans isomerase FklB
MLVAAMLILPGAGVIATEADSPKLDDNTSRISYSLGYQIGGDFKKQNVEMDAQAVVKGIEDALSGARPMIPPKAMSEILAELKRNVMQGDRKRNNKVSRSRERELEYVAEGRNFLAENAKKPGVKTTSSGLQYKILSPGSDRKPGPDDQVKVNYRGSLVDGREFDSSYERNEPATFTLNNVIKGWKEGLQLIGEGGKIQLFIPHVLAYRGSGPLAHRTLIFDVELITVGGNQQARSK